MFFLHIIIFLGTVPFAVLLLSSFRGSLEPWMHPPGSRKVRKLLPFISRVSTLVCFEYAQVVAHLCYPVPFPIELVLGSPREGFDPQTVQPVVSRYTD